MVNDNHVDTQTNSCNLNFLSSSSEFSKYAICYLREKIHWSRKLTINLFTQS